jgi:hypothetical protein
MDEQLIALIDLLGFSSIIKAQDDARQGQILSLLTSLAEAKGDFYNTDTVAPGFSARPRTTPGDLNWTSPES